MIRYTHAPLPVGSVVRCASKVAARTVDAVTYSPVTSKTACCYMSGSNQVTEFRWDSGGFFALIWRKTSTGETYLHTMVAREPSAALLWNMLEKDVLSGLARLSNREAVRGVGSNPTFRKETRATDDASAVHHWLNRAERLYEKSVQKDRAELSKANASLIEESDKRIPSLPKRLEDELKNRSISATVNYADRIHVNVGSVKHWDDNGSLALRGKRMASGSTTKTLVGKREQVRRLLESADYQIKQAEQALVDGMNGLYATYVQFALESQAKAKRIQEELFTKRQAQESAKAVKSLTTVLVSSSVADTARATANQPSKDCDDD